MKKIFYLLVFSLFSLGASAQIVNEYIPPAMGGGSGVDNDSIVSFTITDTTWTIQLLSGAEYSATFNISDYTNGGGTIDQDSVISLTVIDGIICIELVSTQTYCDTLNNFPPELPLFFINDKDGDVMTVTPNDTVNVDNGLERDSANGFDIGLGGRQTKNTSITTERFTFTWNQDNQTYLQTNTFAWTLFPFFPRDSFSWRMWSLDVESNRSVVGVSEGMAAMGSINGPTGQKNIFLGDPDGAFIHADDGLWILSENNDTSSFIVIDTAMLDFVDSTIYILGLGPDSQVVRIPWASVGNNRVSDTNILNTNITADGARAHTLIDNTPAALGFSSVGAANILFINTTNAGEGVGINGTLDVAVRTGTAATMAGWTSGGRATSITLADEFTLDGSGLSVLVDSSEIATNSILGTNINDMGATEGQVLKFSSGEWGPGVDAGDGITSAIGVDKRVTFWNGIKSLSSDPNFLYDYTTDKLTVTGSNGTNVADIGDFQFYKYSSGPFMADGLSYGIGAVLENRTDWGKMALTTTVDNAFTWGQHSGGDTTYYQFVLGERPADFVISDPSKPAFYFDVNNGSPYYYNHVDDVWVRLDSVGSGGSGLPPGTINQTLRHDGSNYVSSSFFTNSGTVATINSPTSTTGAPFIVGCDADQEAIRFYKNGGGAYGQLGLTAGSSTVTLEYPVSSLGSVLLRVATDLKSYVYSTSTGISLGSLTTPTYSLHSFLTDGWKVPSGTTAQRPTSAAGVLRNNSDQSQPEISDGTNWYSYGKKAFGHIYRTGSSGPLAASAAYQHINIGSGWASGELLQFTRTDSTLTYTGSLDKRFEYNCSITTTISATNKTVFWRAADNNVLTGPIVWQKSNSTNDTDNLNLNGIVTLSQNETFEVRWNGNSTGYDVTVESLSCVLKQLD